MPEERSAQHDTDAVHFEVDEANFPTPRIEGEGDVDSAIRVTEQPAAPSSTFDGDLELENVERKLSSYQTLGVVSTLLFGFSASVMFNVSTSRDIPKVPGMDTSILLSVIATSTSMLSTFVYIYHSYHGDSLLSTRNRHSYDRMGPSPAALAYRFIDATRAQRYLAQAFQGISAFSLLGSLCLIIQLSGTHVVGPELAWACTTIVMSSGVFTLLLIWHANRVRVRIRREARMLYPASGASFADSILL